MYAIKVLTGFASFTKSVPCSIWIRFNQLSFAKIPPQSVVRKNLVCVFMTTFFFLYDVICVLRYDIVVQNLEVRNLGNGNTGIRSKASSITTWYPSVLYQIHMPWYIMGSWSNVFFWIFSSCPIGVVTFITSPYHSLVQA